MSHDPSMKRWIVHTKDGYRWRNIGACDAAGAMKVVNDIARTTNSADLAISAELDPDQSEGDGPRQKSVPMG